MNDQILNEITAIKIELAKISSLAQTVKRNSELLSGNGKPGLIVELDRLKTQSALTAKIVWLVAAVIIGSEVPKIVEAVRHVIQ